MIRTRRCSPNCRRAAPATMWWGRPGRPCRAWCGTASFRSETGIKVTLDTYDSNETMLAKLQAGGAGYDVVVPTGPTVQVMVRDGLLMKFDASTMSNFKNVRA